MIAGCGVHTDDDLDTTSGGKADGAIEEGSPLARAVLAVANKASEELLDAEWGVGLDARAAAGIIETRAGADQVMGTSDDVELATIAQLDRVPYVGARAFAHLTAFVRGERVDRSRAMTHEYWELLMPAGRQFVIEGNENLSPGDWTGMKVVAPPGPNKLVAIAEPSVRSYVSTIDAWMRANVNMDVMDIDGSHSVIGDTELAFLAVLVRESDDAVFGATIGYFQLGCDMPDFDADVQTFADQAMAVAAGCMLSDVSWQAHGVFDADAGALDYDPFMDWSGY